MVSYFPGQSWTTSDRSGGEWQPQGTLTGVFGHQRGSHKGPRTIISAALACRRKLRSPAISQDSLMLTDAHDQRLVSNGIQNTGRQLP